MLSYSIIHKSFFFAYSKNKHKKMFVPISVHCASLCFHPAGVFMLYLNI